MFVMNNDKQIKQFNTAKEAYDSTTEKGRIAVMRKTYMYEKVVEVEYYSYIPNVDFGDLREDELYEDFPYCVWSNQSIELINQDDF